MKGKIFLIFTTVAMMSIGVNAAINVNNNNSNNYNDTSAPNQFDWQNDPAYREAQEIKVLENDIRLLDVEIEKCKKKKKGWTAATIVGGVGVVATGVGAIVQANKMSDKQAELKSKEAELHNAQTELSNMK